ncbi:hypothetical protein EVC26_017 [Rhizobium phage RHph_I72]|nr:hypothetical protein EVC26_017 [Rhizobium phage RHph_I72]
MVELDMDPLRIENRVHAGTPDVNFVEGWAELKHTDRWPKRGGPLRLVHPPTPQQIVWATRRWNCGGNTWLVLRVGQEWYAFHGNRIYELWGGGRAPTKTEIETTAAAASVHPLDIARALKAGR